MGGLIVYAFGQKLFPDVDIRWIDPVAAIAVALLIIKAAYGLTLESARDLMDASLPEEEEQWIREYLTGMSKTICSFHNLRTRKAGSNRFVDIHIAVDAEMNVESSHAISEEITERIMERFPGSSVQVHVEPCNHTCSENCVKGCLMGEEYRDSKYSGND